MWARCPTHPCGSTGQVSEEELELLLQKNSPNCQRVFPFVFTFFFFFEKILLLSPAPLYKEGSVLSHSPPLQLDGDCPGQGPTGPSSHLSPAGTHGLRGFTTSSLFPSLRHQATRSLTVLLKPCLTGEGAVNPSLSQLSCGRPGRRGPGAAAALVPTLVPGTLLS